MEIKCRKTPTERQIQALMQMPTTALVDKPLEAMHALNRRAKTKRDQRNQYRRATFGKAREHQVDDIYALKDKFLDVLVLRGRAQIYTFTIRSQSPETLCPSCGRSWWGGGDCFCCGDSGVPLLIEHEWFLVESGGYRFHQPSVSPEAACLATPMEAHNPEQPAREIPVVEVTVESRGGGKVTKATIGAQMECVKLATARLAAMGPTAGTDCPAAP